MSINRRRFLQTLGVGAAAFMMDPERLLWVPGAKTIFIPKDAGKVESYTQEDMDNLLAINRIAFGVCYTDPQDVLRESKRTGKDPFVLYRDWERRVIL